MTDITKMPDDIEIARHLEKARGLILEALPTTRSPRLTYRARLGIVVSGAAVVVLGISGGSLAVVQATHEQVSYSVQCFAGASTESSSTTIGHPQVTDRVTGVNGQRQSADPIADCSFAWKAGLIGQKSAPADPNSANFPVPDLVACTLPDGVGAGFPRVDRKLSDHALCESLGLSVWRH
jgi:hypothetical protein